ncbi:GNAT family N-acetyltransferase [Devosia sp. ZW T5_3]|uniref:GNAT family N-acetyltransferase n=1 Tax=Devosia sp. ZW T5_3 TaxID=3378085 RepID=UPI003851E3BD
MKNYRIFAIGHSDLPRVASLARRIWPEAFAKILPVEAITPMLDDIYALATLTADIDIRDHQYWLASIADQDVGYVSAYVEGGRVWIKKLYVLSETRGSGLGKALIKTVVDQFGSELPIALNVNDANHAAISFYKSAGFEIEGHAPVRMGPYDFHDFVMVKR